MCKKLKKGSDSRTKIIAVVTVLFIGIVFTNVLLGMIATNISYGDKKSHASSVTDERKIGSKLDTSAPSEKICINDTGSNNWTWAKAQSLCSGSGTLIDPYVIEDLTIDCGGSGSGIFIENSNAYFRIENCTVYNSGSESSDAGIKLKNTDHGYIIGCVSSQNYNGIYLSLSNNNTFVGNTVNNNIASGIFLYWGCNNNTFSGNTANYNYDGIWVHVGHDNTVSGNIANYNHYGLLIFNSHNNTISGNTVNYNDYGIYLFDGGSNNISENTASYNDYGIYLHKSNDNIVSKNTLVGNVFFIEDDGCTNNIIEDNAYYTIILPSGINEFEVEPYGVDDIDVNISIALDNNTQVLFSAFNNNTSDVPLDNELIFMNLQLNDTDNLNQTIDAPINITLKYNVLKYKPLNAFWFNESANGGHGAWEEISFTNLGNGIIIISLNHTSIFALVGTIKSFPLSIGNGNGGDGVYNINRFLFLILVVFICSITIITASSTYYYKTRSKTRAKPTIIDKKLLRVEFESNIDLYKKFEFTSISNDIHKKIDGIDWKNESEKEPFIHELLALTPEERDEIVDYMLEKSKLKNIHDSKRFNLDKSSIRTSKKIIDKIVQNQLLYQLSEKDQFESNIDLFKKFELTSISNDIYKKIDGIDWKNESEKEPFIHELLALTPEERDEIVDYMVKKSKNNDYS